MCSSLRKATKRLLITVEVETGESVNPIEARAEWGVYSKLKVPLHLYVPPACVEAAKRICDEYQIVVSELWTYTTSFDQVRFTHGAPLAGRADREGAGGQARADRSTAEPVVRSRAERRSRSRPRPFDKLRVVPSKVEGRSRSRREAEACRESRSRRKPSPPPKPRSKPAAKKAKAAKQAKKIARAQKRTEGAEHVPFLRLTRDRRGFENTFLMHADRPGDRPRLLYWYRTAPGVMLGRAALDEDAIRTIEEQHPDIDFDWPAILALVGGDDAGRRGAAAAPAAAATAAQRARRAAIAIATSVATRCATSTQVIAEPRRRAREIRVAPSDAAPRILRRSGATTTALTDELADRRNRRNRRLERLVDELAGREIASAPACAVCGDRRAHRGPRSSTAPRATRG